MEFDNTRGLICGNAKFWNRVKTIVGKEESVRYDIFTTLNALDMSKCVYVRKKVNL